MTPSASALPDDRNGFSLLIHTSRADLTIPVAPFKAAVRPDGTAAPIDPPHHDSQEWATAAWIEQSAYPSASPGDVTYVYGHACHYHLCSFTELHELPANSDIAVVTGSTTLTYRLCAVGRSPKTSNLVVPTCRGGSHVDLVLVTCEFEQGDTSTDNLVLAATLLTSTHA